MATPFTFRSAFHGFHREDVIHYIEYLTAKHTAQINELNAEIDYLRSQLEDITPDADTPEQMMDAQLQGEEELKQLADAIENNTKIMEKLYERIGGKG